MFKDFITGETLASSSQWSDSVNGTVVDCDDAKWSFVIEKA